MYPKFIYAVKRAVEKGKRFSMVNGDFIQKINDKYYYCINGRITYSYSPYIASKKFCNHLYDYCYYNVFQCRH